jgi:hypothetical protein
MALVKRNGYLSITLLTKRTVKFCLEISYFEQSIHSYLYLAGDAHIYINEDKVPRKISDYNMRAGFHKTIPIRLTLKAGPVNTLKFGCTGPEGLYIHVPL